MKNIKIITWRLISGNRCCDSTVEGLSILDSIYPSLQPEHTIIFYSTHSRKYNFFTIRYYKYFIKKIYKWAIRHGLNIFIVDYTTPFGLLALETLSQIKETKACRTEFLLYCVKSSRITERQDYRIIRSSDVELFNLVTKSDYDYIYLKPEDTLDLIYPNVGVHCIEGQVLVLQEWIPYLT